jgi:hypothetical protein
MSKTPSLGSFNQDKVANKFGIQLKPKGSSQQLSTGTSNITKNKTVSDFRTDNSTNGFLSNTNRSTSSKTSEPIKKIPEKSITSKSTSALTTSSINNERTNSLTSNVNHSTATSKQPSPAKSPATTKRSNIISTERSVSPVPPVKRPSVSITTPKTEAQVEHLKDQPLYRRQLSKPLDNSSLSIATTPAAAAASTTSLKR